jgi:hypothetical protein
MTSAGSLPDAVAAVVAAVLAEHPAASPERLGRLVVEQLRADGWWIRPPAGRDTTDAVTDESPIWAA